MDLHAQLNDESQERLVPMKHGAENHENGHHDLNVTLNSPGLADEILVDRLSRIASPRRMLQFGEISGALGDFGTFLPDVIALANNPLGPGPPPESMVFFSGFWSAFAGFLFDLPMPIQPMHAIVAVALTEGLSYSELVAAGVWLGGIFLFLGSLGLVEWCKEKTPLPVVRGLQLGLGMKVVITGAGFVVRAVKLGAVDVDRCERHPHIATILPKNEHWCPCLSLHETTNQNYQGTSLRGDVISLSTVEFSFLIPVNRLPFKKSGWLGFCVSGGAAGTRPLGRQAQASKPCLIRPRLRRRRLAGPRPAARLVRSPIRAHTGHRCRGLVGWAVPGGPAAAARHAPQRSHRHLQARRGPLSSG